MKIKNLRTRLFSVPIESPVRTSFGTMNKRDLILVELVTDDGQVGLGESWCNFPSWAPRERVATLDEGVKPLLVDRELDDVPTVTTDLIARLEPLGMQWGARGPIFQAISAVDIALWDLKGKRANKPISELLSDSVAKTVPVYASGLGPANPLEVAAPLYNQGVRLLKLKVGFDAQTDRFNIRQLKERYPDAELAVDANQAWDYETTMSFAPFFEEVGCLWLEEPVPAWDVDTLRALNQSLPCMVAGGENYYGIAEFEHVLSQGALGLVQPDVTKAGGISQAVEVCKAAGSLGLPHALHYLSGGLGFVASLHVFSAMSGGVAMEMDANKNPMLTEFLAGDLPVIDGEITVPSGPGLGISISQEFARRYEWHM